MRTNEVRIHHRGGGSPSSTWSDYHYALIINRDRYRLQFGPEGDTSTKGENRRVLGVCFDGNREVYPVTDLELSLLRAGIAEARRRGYVTDHPNVLPHCAPQLQPLGNATLCPGRHAVERMPHIAGACHAQIFDVAKWIEDLGVLWPGMFGRRVQYLQALLNVAVPGTNLRARGTFGPRTLAALLKFKRAVPGFNPTSPRVGRRVWGALIYIAGAKAEGK
jgi:hypothetical protein